MDSEARREREREGNPGCRAVPRPPPVQCPAAEEMRTRMRSLGQSLFIDVHEHQPEQLFRAIRCLLCVFSVFRAGSSLKTLIGWGLPYLYIYITANTTQNHNEYCYCYRHAYDDDNDDDDDDDDGDGDGDDDGDDDDDVDY